MKEYENKFYGEKLFIENLKILIHQASKSLNYIENVVLITFIYSVVFVLKVLSHEKFPYNDIYDIYTHVYYRRGH